jgi:hypothetical protein
MTDIVPTKGRIVWYVLSEQDCAAINARRKAAGEHRDYHHANQTGVMVHAGNEAKPGAIYPAMVVETWGDKPDSCVNLKVELDGNDSFWATSRQVGVGPGTYHWMPYQKGQAAKYEALEKKVEDAAKS